MNNAKHVILAFVLCASPAIHAQQLRSGSWNTERFLLRYRTMLEPERTGGSRLNIGGGGVDDATTNHRVLTDSAQKKYFGYDLQVDAVGGRRFTVIVRPLTLPADSIRLLGIDSTWTQIPLPSYPGTVQVNDGETIAFDLMFNPTTNQKIVEYVNISSPSKSSAATGTARDLQLGDVQMSLSSPRLSVNGKHWDWNDGDSHGEANGAIVWVYVRDRGRFWLSFLPQPGYRRSGEISGKKIRFNWNGDVYELDSQAKVLPGQGPWNLYVSQEAGFRPAYPPVLYGAATTQ